MRRKSIARHRKNEPASWAGIAPLRWHFTFIAILLLLMVLVAVISNV